MKVGRSWRGRFEGGEVWWHFEFVLEGVGEEIGFVKGRVCPRVYRGVFEGGDWRKGLEVVEELTVEAPPLF